MTDRLTSIMNCCWTELIPESCLEGEGTAPEMTETPGMVETVGAGGEPVAVALAGFAAVETVE